MLYIILGQRRPWRKLFFFKKNSLWSPNIMTILWFTDRSQAMWGFLFFSLEVWMFTVVANLEKIPFWALVCFQNSLYIVLLLVLMWDSKKVSHNTLGWLYFLLANSLTLLQIEKALIKIIYSTKNSLTKTIFCLKMTVLWFHSWLSK